MLRIASRLTALETKKKNIQTPPALLLYETVEVKYMHSYALSSSIRRGHLIVSPEISFCCFILVKGRVANFLLATLNEGGVASGELLVNVSEALESGERLYFRHNMPGEAAVLHSNTKAN